MDGKELSGLVRSCLRAWLATVLKDLPRPINPTVSFPRESFPLAKSLQRFFNNLYQQLVRVKPDRKLDKSPGHANEIGMG